MSAQTTTESFFEALYQSNSDPWGFSTSAYETRRYDATMQALAHRTFARAFEPGCSIGVLTERLTHQCAAVEAVDLSQTAVQQAQRRCAGTNATIRHGSLPKDIPAGSFDLIVFSEIGYYFDEPALETVVERLMRNLEPGGIMLGVHWTGCSPDHVLSGDRVHEIIRSAPELNLQLSKRYDGFILERWERA